MKTKKLTKKDKELITSLEQGGSSDSKKYFDELLRRAVKAKRESVKAL